MRPIAATGRLALWCSVLLLLPAPAAWAAEFVVDFETVNPFSGGTLVTDQAASGSQSLYLGPGNLATLDIPAGLLNRDLVVTMMVFDQGRWIDRAIATPPRPRDVYGPRWGVSGLDATVTPITRRDCGATIIEKSFLSSAGGYGFSAAVGTESRTGSWYSVQWFGGPRQCTLSANGGTDDGAGGWLPGTPGTGRWTKWTFKVAASGAITFYYTGSGPRTHNLGGPADQIWLQGGGTGATSGLPLAGAWIDDVRIWSADPMALGSTVDFEGENANPFSGGAVSTDQAVSGTQSLYLGPGDEALLPLNIPLDYTGDGIEVTMKVFDLGKWIDRTITGYPTSVYGPRWGVSTGTHLAGECAGVTIIEKPQLGTANGYGYDATEARFASDWFSPYFYGGPRAGLSSNGGTNDGSGWVMGTPGTGVWTTWTFRVDRATNEVTCSREGGATVVISAALAGPISEIWLWGGGPGATSGLPLAGVYIDDITLNAYTNPPTELAIHAELDWDWVYQNTAVVTADRHKSVLMVEITAGALAGETYEADVLQDGGLVVDFRIDPSKLPATLIEVDGVTGTTIDICGGRVGESTPSPVGPPGDPTLVPYTLTVVVSSFQDGIPTGRTASADLLLRLRKLADIDGDGDVTAPDKLEMNKYLNGLANLPGIGLHALDLTDDGITVNAEDKLVINQVLNGLAVP